MTDANTGIGTGIHVGHESTDHTVLTVAESIVNILGVCRDRETAVAAMKAFTQATSINGVTISGATITNNAYALEVEPDDDYNDYDD